MHTDENPKAEIRLAAPAWRAEARSGGHLGARGSPKEIRMMRRHILPRGTDDLGVEIAVTAGNGTFTLFCGMKRRAKPVSAASAKRWARRILDRVDEIIALHPGADRGNVLQTLILLELPSLERLQRSLIRGRAAAKQVAPDGGL
jgi:hypothetical protein